MSSEELVVLLLCLAGVHLAGFAGSRRGREDFVLAGRSLRVPLLVSTLVATWYGAILASGEFVLRYGIVFLLCFGVPYYIVAVIYATWLSGRIRGRTSSSIPEQIGAVYGPSARRIAALLLLVITVPASYQLMLGHLISYHFGWSLPSSVIIGTVISVSYVLVGGLRSDVYANVVQALLMFIGMGLLVAASVWTFGGPENLMSDQTRPLFNIPGSLGWAGILSWFVISLQTLIDPSFYVRAASAESAHAARRAILWSVACWVVFDLLQFVAGLYTARFVPQAEVTSSYLELAAAVLPAWGRGIVIAGIVAAISSTLSGYALVSASTIARDLFPRPSVDGVSNARSNRIGLMISCVAGAAIAINAPSFVDLILQTASIVVSALLLPTLLSHTDASTRFRSSIISLMILPAACAILSIVTDVGQPALIGLSSSLFLHAYHWLKWAQRT